MCQMYTTSNVDKSSVETGYKLIAGQPDYKYGAVPSAQKCMDACTADSNCIGWIHHNNKASDELRGQCSLIANKPDGAKDFRGFK